MKMSENKLATELMTRRLSLVGTVRSNRRGIPHEKLPNATRELHSSKFGFSSDGVTLVSYVPKTEKSSSSSISLLKYCQTQHCTSE